MAVDDVFDGADFRVKVTSLRHEIPLEERECFAFFATELAKLRKHIESAKANDLILAHGFFPLVRKSNTAKDAGTRGVSQIYRFYRFRNIVCHRGITNKLCGDN
ncbi:MAG: hypothetical protein UV89_C0038G0006 [candidate division WWE3 bacterium GW2011_GWB2_43_22]|uniref:Uncharacterized protein n=1 Tax=candidate division WWE3 bacterium GW2011_GWB2_43_22 TaxID=1619118 RepID=A0A0G1EGV5_UNCKA|nr:MAG: hypothetical protein UV89_C0038G0006 [candidate division WWE3 bacterium GW2011_GWB2_43_22]